MIDKIKENNLLKNQFIEKQLNIIIKKQIGKGGFGSVYSINLKNRNYAMKIFETEDEKKIKKEIKLSLHCKASNIIKTLKENILNYFGKKIYILIMEYAKFQDLNIFFFNYFNHNLIKVINNTQKFNWINNFPELCIQFFTYQIINIFKFLDNNSIVHFDIKTENLFLTDNFIIKLGDFSLSQTFIKNENKLIFLPNATIKSMGPEFYIKNYSISSNNIQKVDFFALGCILYYIIKKDFLIKRIKNKNKEPIGTNKDDILKIINNGIQEIKSMDLDKNLKDLICSLLKENYEQRPNIYQLIDNKWINENKKQIQKINDINFDQDIKTIIEFQKFKPLSSIKKRKYKYTL